MYSGWYPPSSCHPKPQWVEDQNQSWTAGVGTGSVTALQRSALSTYQITAVPAHGAGPWRKPQEQGSCGKQVFPTQSSTSMHLISFQTHLPCPQPALPFLIHPTTHTQPLPLPHPLPARRGVLSRTFAPFLWISLQPVESDRHWVSWWHEHRTG